MPTIKAVICYQKGKAVLVRLNYSRTEVWIPYSQILNYKFSAEGKRSLKEKMENLKRYQKIMADIPCQKLPDHIEFIVISEWLLRQWQKDGVIKKGDYLKIPEKE